jgi:large conductance mechanosensitive channel
MKDFLEFIRRQGVVGLAVGFLMGGAISKTVAALVDDVINPLVGLAVGKVGLAEAAVTVGGATLKWGHFVAALVDFIIIAAVVYFGVRSLGLDKLDKKEAKP